MPDKRSWGKGGVTDATVIWFASCEEFFDARCFDA
jgi:hypothetical protein